MKFHKSTTIEDDIKNEIRIINTKTSSQDKERIIQNSTNLKQITLLTKEFGRGTDFVTRDDLVLANGGVYVIQTFLSEQESEEFQIKGRTARNGQQGSYFLVLNKLHLEKFLIKNEEIEANSGSKLYPFLNSKRKSFFNEVYNSKKRFIEKVEKEHKITIQFYKDLKDNKLDNIKKYLSSKNSSSSSANVSVRVLILLDATGSMDTLIEKSKNNLFTMFEHACGVLEKKNLDSKCFELQIGVYRDYDCGLDGILGCLFQIMKI